MAILILDFLLLTDSETFLLHSMVKKILNPLLSAVTALVFIALVYYGPPPFDRLEEHLYDLEMKMGGNGDTGKTSLVLIDIDDQSLKRLGQWPWPRRVLAELIDKLDENGANLIGLCIPLLDREATQGLREVTAFREKFDAYIEDKQDNALIRWTRQNLRNLQEGLDNDALLVNSLRKCNKVILAGFASVGAADGQFTEDQIDILSRNFLGPSKQPPPSGKKETPQLTAMPFDALSQAALGLGHGNMTFEQRKTVRSHPVYIRYKNSLLPSLPLRMAIADAKQLPRQVPVEPGGIRMKEAFIPLVQGEMLLRYPMVAHTLPRFSFADVLMVKNVPGIIKGSNVIIGFNSFDSRKVHTPVSAALPEHELAARILDNILKRNFVARPSYMVHLEALAVVLLAVFAAFFFPKMRLLPRTLWTLGLVVLILASGMVLLSMLDIWFKTGVISVYIITVFLVFSVSHFIRGERISQQSIESNRLLGLSLQSQGLLDMAFEKFKKLPPDNETKDLIYNLGLEYERKRLINKAIEAYEFISKWGLFRDLEDRIPRLRDSDKSSTLGSHSDTRELPVIDSALPEGMTKIGRYDILGTLGKGSMGLVYKALDPKINRLLAIKTIRFSEEFDEDVISEIKERFFREAEIAGQLSHPSIVTVYDVGEHADLTYMAMEFLEGNDLENYISKKTLLPFRKVLDVVARVAGALHYAHKQDVIHRDIKPANIMLLDKGGVKVTDFGIAKAISSSRTKTGVILGTPNYMSPEQIMGQKIDNRSDIFSLGVLFFQLLTGETPFHGDNLSSLLYQITQVKHPAIREYNPKVPKACEKILDKALAKNPNMRFKTAGEMGQYLKLLASKVDQLLKRSSQ